MTATLARPARPPLVHAARRLLRTHLLLLGWFWGIVAVAAVVVNAILAAFDQEDLSVVSFGRQAGVWFPFSLQIMVATTYVRVHVAAGLTRRSYTATAVLSAVALAVVNASVMATLLVLERLVHRGLGWDWVLQDAAFDATGRSWPLMVLDYGLTFLLGNLCGLLVGTVYYAAGARWGSVVGAWVGTLTLPVTAGPVLVGLTLAATQSEPKERFLDVVDLTVGGVTGIGLALAALVGAAFVLIARRSAIARVHA